MKAFLSKYLFFLLVIFSTITIEFIEWRILLKKFTPNMDPGVEYDFILYTRLFFVSLHYVWLFTNLSFMLALGIILLFKSKIEKGLVLNIYYSLIYLFISTIIIEIFFNLLAWWDTSQDEKTLIVRQLFKLTQDATDINIFIKHNFLTCKLWPGTRTDHKSFR